MKFTRNRCHHLNLVIPRRDGIKGPRGLSCFILMNLNHLGGSDVQAETQPSRIKIAKLSGKRKEKEKGSRPWIQRLQKQGMESLWLRVPLTGPLPLLGMIHLKPSSLWVPEELSVHRCHQSKGLRDERQFS